MTALALSTWWFVGWVVGVVVIGLVAFLLVTIIRLGKQITGQAVAITTALDGARENTLPLWDVRTTNSAVDRITRGLAAAREGLSK